MDEVKAMMGSSKEREASDAAKEVANRGKEAVTAAGKDTAERGQVDIAALREDLNDLKDMVMRTISSTASDVASSARDATANLAGRVNNAAGELAEKGRDAVHATTDHAKNIVDELEGVARRNPIGTLAAAVVVGILIGMTGRRN
jgi:ElaB/YqjD/DUF883 family membrane-anchored ribosome-binding protein